MITKDNAVELLLKDNVIVQSYVYSYKSKKYWKIVSPLTIQLSDGTIIEIPKDFYYDMSTVPKMFWSIARPFNDGLLGYLIHDYLYINQHKHSLTRKQTDKEMLFWTTLTNNKNNFDNYIRYFFVRMFGWIWWKKLI